MPMIHDPEFRRTAVTRLQALTADSPRRWGTMTVDQMLCHVNRGMENSLGRLKVEPVHIPLPRPLLKFVILSLPWRKGKTPTAPEFVAKERYDFERERERTLRLIGEIAERPTSSAWPDSAFMGAMTGTEWSRLIGKHIDYHLQQFGV